MLATPPVNPALVWMLKLTSLLDCGAIVPT